MRATTLIAEAGREELPIVHVLMGFVCVWHRHEPQQADHED
ncbi:hypothetical protein N5C16_02885 [Stenotrophomonas sp. GD03908]|uniref:Uncharacterized protein n=1 Tax=Stenotrophomonas maltophilia TaxID=40324 RepID=A0AAJ2TN53_STEMA|nr:MULTISPECIES: hypothetical protein [Stenotrophomonas]MDH0978209.1 hypothetical protein [Stenotrophomonas sp. GD03908]MDQ7292928.1 hypothetical protein [Stenotrophomonas sp. Sm0041]MDZ5763487.1 hypothetical protein [Stenotrophomonas maltophilia]